MRAKRVFAFLALLVTGLAVMSAPAMAQTGVLFTRLTGAAVPGGGDPTGSGVGVVLVNDQTNQVCTLVVVFGIGTATGAHIHSGAPGETGPHAVDLATPTNGFSYSCTTASEQVVSQLLANPGNFYLNVHSEEFPSGAVRGQLSSVVPAGFNFVGA